MSQKRGFFTNLFGGSKSSSCCNMEIIEDEKTCNCEENCSDESVTKEFVTAETEQANILILGPGCKNCQKLEHNVRKALDRIGKNEKIAHVTDFSKIAAYGIMNTPGLVIGKNVVSSGKVLNVDTIIGLLEKNL